MIFSTLCGQVCQRKNINSWVLALKVFEHIGFVLETAYGFCLIFRVLEIFVFTAKWFLAGFYFSENLVNSVEIVYLKQTRQVSVNTIQGWLCFHYHVEYLLFYYEV